MRPTDGGDLRICPATAPAVAPPLRGCIVAGAFASVNMSSVLTRLGVPSGSEPTKSSTDFEGDQRIPRREVSLLANVWRLAQAGFRWRAVHPVDIPGGIDRDEDQGIV